MRLFGMTVGRNEADRYLNTVLTRTAALVDGWMFYDDQSTDNTADIAAEYCTVYIRGDNEPSFLKHEGRFRQNAWELLERQYRPEPGDWILAIDCDELVVCHAQHRIDDPYLIRHAIDRAIAAAPPDVDAFMVHIPECFGFQDGTPMIRTDGWWGKIYAPRLFRWRPGGHYRSVKMGCGSAPHYASAGKHSKEPLGVSIMHFGYANPADVKAKYDRYRKHGGHSNKHIRSIVENPVLEPWDGPFDPFELKS